MMSVPWRRSRIAALPGEVSWVEATIRPVEDIPSRPVERGEDPLSEANTPAFYRVGDQLLRLAFWIYFRKLEIASPENIPTRGPVILAANHPHSIMDALVLGRATGRTVHYLAHSGLFEPAWRAFFLRHAGVLPIFRPSDVTQAKEHNVQTFQACTQLLSRGGCIGIFPEGTSHEAPRVQDLRTGTARLALEAEGAVDFTLGVRIVPVGLSFESPRHFRSRVLVSFGHPIDVRDFRDAYREDPQETVRSLTTALAERIRSQVLHIERSELGELVHQIERLVQDETSDRQRAFRPRASRFHRRQFVAREVARAVDRLFERDPSALWNLNRRLQEYHDALSRSRLSDEMVRMQKDPTVQRRLLQLALLTALAFPPAAYGLLFNYVPYRLTGLGVRRLTSDPTKIHGFQLLVGAGVYLLYYPPLLVGAHRFFDGSWPRTLAFTASLLPSGFFARWFLYRLAQERRMLRFAWFSTVHRAALLQARRLRRLLLEEMDAFLRDESNAPRAMEDTRPGRSGKD